MILSEQYRGQTLEKTEIQSVIKAINDSMKILKTNSIEQGIDIDCGGHTFRWNYIFKGLRTYFTGEDYKIIKIDRGALWKPIAIYNIKTKILYLLMKNDNIERVRKNKDSKRHYAKVLNIINDKFTGYKSEQSCFLPPKDIDNDLLEELETIIKDISEVECCKIISFDEKFNNVFNIEECIYNSALVAIDTCKLNDYIVADINDISDTENPESISLEFKEYKTLKNKDIELSFRKDNIIKLKDKKKDKEKKNNEME